MTLDSPLGGCGVTILVHLGALLVLPLPPALLHPVQEVQLELTIILNQTSLFEVQLEITLSLEHLYQTGHYFVTQQHQEGTAEVSHFAQEQSGQF